MPIIGRLFSTAVGTGAVIAIRRTVADLGTDSCWYPATSAQQGLWILDKVDRLRPSYLLPSVIEFTGEVAQGSLVASVRRALARHPALRSRFRLAVAHRRVEYRTDAEPAEVGFTDAVADGWSADELADFIEALCYTPFDLAAEAPARAEVIRVDHRTTLLVLTVHHIVFDGVSRQLLMAEIARTYQAVTRGEDPRLPEPGHPADVVGDPSPDGMAERVAQVLDRLRGAPRTVELPYDCDTEDLSMIGATGSVRLDERVTGAVLAVAARAGCTAFMTGVALLAGTLARSGKQRDFLFAVVWPGREDPVASDVIGMFMTTLVLRIGLDDRTTWCELLREARSAGLETFVDADVPLDVIAAALDSGRDVTRPPITPVLVNMAEPAGPIELAPGVLGQYRPLDPQYSKWDLGLFVGLAGEGASQRLELSLDYPAALFKPTTVTDLLTALRRSAEDLAMFPEEPVLKPIADDHDLDDPAVRLELVRTIWREVLETDDVGDDVSFFDAGGDSLRLVMLVERLSQASGRPLRTVDLFRAGTVRGQADLLADADPGTGPGAPTGEPASGRDRLLAIRDRRGPEPRV